MLVPLQQYIYMVVFCGQKRSVGVLYYSMFFKLNYLSTTVHVLGVSVRKLNLWTTLLIFSEFDYGMCEAVPTEIVKDKSSWGNFQCSVNTDIPIRSFQFGHGFKSTVPP